jgi:predicted dinucleotide-binding enzyme/DMSO/TMAO reductase YedYZ heme-binding membrane subunit
MKKMRTEKITVIGTGNYGIAIGRRLLNHGFEVIFGSRCPNYSYLKECLTDINSSNFSVIQIKQAFLKSDKFVFLAISDDAYDDFADQINQIDSTKKIIIDLSNLSNPNVNSNISNAEKLSKLLANKHIIVKAFNQINAFSIAEYSQQNIDKISIAGDDLESKELLKLLCSKLGFIGVDIGPLKNALQLEQSNIKTFEEWKSPFLNSSLFLLFNFIWIFLIYFYFPKKTHTFSQYLNDFSLLSHTNKVLGFTSLQLLAFVYLASIFASLYQLKNGTKYKRFPKYLDNWLKSRKQYGLITFLFSSAHVITSLLVAQPSYISDWFKKQDNNKMTLNGEINMLTGIIAYLIMAIVALTSINSISNGLNWSEWRFVQTNLGISCLTIGLLHTFAMYMRIYLEKDENKYDFIYLITRVKLISIYFPLLVLLLRFFFSYFPPINKRLENIRKSKIITVKKCN